MYSKFIASALHIPFRSVEATLQLLGEGATIPFIARYRKEMTGLLDEVQIADIQSLQKKLEELDKRRAAILESITEQGKLTPALEKSINAALTMTELEDLYLPYRQKRKTRASVAIERGLEPLARAIFAQEPLQVATEAAKYLKELVPSAGDSLQGARDIIAEWVNEDATSRDAVRRFFDKTALITSRMVRGKEEAAAKYKDYFEWSEKLSTCPSHRMLAMRRGEDEGFLRVSVAPEMEENVVAGLEKQHLRARNEASEQVAIAIKDSYKRLLQPSIETEYRNTTKEKADLEAIKVFADNLRQLLLAAPLGEKATMGIDPGFRTGCKVVCLDARGNLLHHTVIYPHPPQNQAREASETILHLVKKHNIDAISVGNGTAGRETIDLLRSIRWEKQPLLYLVNEAGASIYSASEAAREEFPKEDITVRGAVSIGRRLMDPLAELVKIDAKSIGVGQYQHDVNQSLLKDALDRTVESSVNAVGINLNTASKHLLTYVSGLGATLAQNIVNYRAENGAFKSRTELHKVARLGGKAFEQCAGFLRIRDAKHPLDNTGVHPERYSLVENMAKDANCTVHDLLKTAPLRKAIDLKLYINGDVGLPTLHDIMKELEKPGLDPRGEAQPFEFAGVRTIEDLHEGMELPAIVTNITNFGVFIDLGIKDSGFVHISQLANKFVKTPSDVVQLQQQVRVRVLEVDLQRKRVACTMKV